MEFKEKNNAGKMETWRVENGIRKKVYAFIYLLQITIPEFQKRILITEKLFPPRKHPN